MNSDRDAQRRKGTADQANVPDGSTAIDATSTALRRREGSSVEITQVCLARAEVGANGAWHKLTPERALAQAAEADRRRAASTDPGPLHGIPVAIKDNIDMQGETSLAGSAARSHLPPAAGDAPLIARLAAAGAVFIGRTNMTEYAFTAVGAGSPFLEGTTTHPYPVNQIDSARVPGGSSSGSAVAAAAGEAVVALGSDTGGSIRIPAAFNGLVGLKPTTGRLDLTGVVPLSTTLDCVGPITRTVADAAAVWRVLSGGGDPATTTFITTDQDRSPAANGQRPIRLRVLIPSTVFLNDLDTTVGGAFERAVRVFERLGLIIEEHPVAVLDDIGAAYRYGSFAGHEAYRDHGALIRERSEVVDPEIAAQIMAYEQRDPADYDRLTAERARIRQEFGKATAGFDLFLAPTVPCLPPLLAEADSPAARDRLGIRVLRNTIPWNFLGLPALTVPAAGEGDARMAGITLAGPAGTEELLLAAGSEFEAVR